MIVEIHAKLIKHPTLEPEVAPPWDNEEKEYNLFSINKYNLLYIVPGKTEDYALVCFTDGTILQTMDPYPYVKTRFNEFPLYYN